MQLEPTPKPMNLQPVFIKNKQKALNKKSRYSRSNKIYLNFHPIIFNMIHISMHSVQNSN